MCFALRAYPAAPRRAAASSGYIDREVRAIPPWRLSLLARRGGITEGAGLRRTSEDSKGDREVTHFLTARLLHGTGARL